MVITELSISAINTALIKLQKEIAELRQKLENSSSS